MKNLTILTRRGGRKGTSDWNEGRQHNRRVEFTIL
jgi:flagellar motor protein MotB